MKRWFIPLVCLVLVFSMVAPFPALAAYNFVNLSDHFVSKSSDNGLDIYTYNYNDGRSSLFEYYDASGNVFRQVEYSRTSVFDYSLRKKYSLQGIIGFGDIASWMIGSDTDGFYFADVNSVSNFKQATVSMTVTLRSSSATTVTLTPEWRYMSSGNSVSASKSGTSTSVSLVAGVAKTVALSFSFSSVTTGYVTSNIATVNVIGPPEPPQITQNLGAGTVEYEQGELPIPLIITAITLDGGELTYQWYENNADSSEGGSLIEGARSDRYSPSTSVIGIKYYYCVITNTISGYTASTTSSVGAVRVVSPPDPAVQPVITSDLSTEEVIYMTGSAAAALRIGAEAPDGGELTYQWYSMTDSPSSGVAGTAIPGANTASYTPETVVAGTTYYYCVVTNKLNDTSADVRSKVAMITVEEPPPETVPPQLDEMNDKLDETNNLLDWISAGIGGMWSAILDLPQAILDGIKGLFVPDAESIAAYQEQWSELLKERFGAIYESVDVIGDFVSSLNSGSKQDQITFPAVTVTLAGVPWSFGGWSVNVVPEGFSFLATSSKLIVNIIATFAFINGLRNKFEGILGGRGS